jgi:hypothetical protein
MEKTRTATGNAYLTRKGFRMNATADSHAQNRRRDVPRR